MMKLFATIAAVALLAGCVSTRAQELNLEFAIRNEIGIKQEAAALGSIARQGINLDAKSALEKAHAERERATAVFNHLLVYDGQGNPIGPANPNGITALTPAWVKARASEYAVAIGQYQNAVERIEGQLAGQLATVESYERSLSERGTNARAIAKNAIRQQDIMRESQKAFASEAMRAATAIVGAWEQSRRPTLPDGTAEPPPPAETSYQPPYVPTDDGLYGPGEPWDGRE